VRPILADPLRDRRRAESTDGWRCRAYATDLATGDRLDGEWITWAMVKAEGWLSKPGSKWKTMPGQMIRYRAASFWTRTYAPEISLGMHTSEEIAEVTERGEPSLKARDLNAAIEDARVEIIPSGPSINGADVPCPECQAKPMEPHQSACPFNDETA
jgi:hypothetical protein